MQAGLRPCYSQTLEDRLSRLEAYINILYMIIFSLEYFNFIQIIQACMDDGPRKESIIKKTAFNISAFSSIVKLN